MTEVRAGQSVTLTVQWYAAPGGPPADVTGQTITISPTGGGAAVIGPTAVDIEHEATGLYSYLWETEDDLAAGEYVALWEADGPIQSSEVVTVTEAYGSSYATLTELKARLQISDATEDDMLELALVASSRCIDDWCRRSFSASTAASTRVYAPLSGELAIVDDFWTTDGLVIATGYGDDVYDTTLGTADRFLEPVNGLVGGQSGWPYWRIRTRNGALYPSALATTLQVTAKWGWAAIPAPVHQACLILAEEIYKLKDTPFGVAGYGEYGAVRVRDNPKVASMLAPYRREAVLVA